MMVKFERVLELEW